MIPVICRNGGDGSNGEYGDCLRACIASIIEKPSEDVPHFYHDGCDGETGMKRVRDYLDTLNYAPVFTSMSGSWSFEFALKVSGESVSGCHYLLFGEGHVVVCKDGEVVHDPAWVKSVPRLKKPVNNDWIIMVVAIK